MTSKNVILLSFIVLCALFSQVESENSQSNTIDDLLGLDTVKLAYNVKKTVIGLINKAARDVEQLVYRVKKALSNLNAKCHKTLKKWADDAEVRLGGLNRTVADVNLTVGICVFDTTIKNVQKLPIELCQLGKEYQKNATLKLNVFERRARIQLKEIALDANAIVDKGSQCAKEAGLISFKCYMLLVGEIGQAATKIPGKVAKFLANVDALLKVFQENGVTSIKSVWDRGDKVMEAAKKCVFD